MIRDRESILADIRGDVRLTGIYTSWTEARQQEFMDFCTGARGVKILYDTFFRRVFNTEDGKSNLIGLLSVLLGKDISDVKLLPPESGLAADGSLVIMDLIVRLADGSIVNVEIQKHGYKFPGQRAACYSADLVMRQYQRVKELAREKAKSSTKSASELVNYKDVKPVYTFVIIEDSTAEFHKFPDKYIHRIRPVSDTGIRLDLLQEYVFIPLDIFLPILQDRGIRDELDAWIAFLSTDDPQVVLKLLESYPAIFRPIYKQIYEVCLNTEDAINMFSEALSILDRNTVLTMQEEMREEIHTLQAETSALQEEKSALQEEKSALQEEKSALQEENSSLQEEIRSLSERIRALEAKDSQSSV